MGTIHRNSQTPAPRQQNLLGNATYQTNLAEYLTFVTTSNELRSQILGIVLVLDMVSI